MSERKIKRLNRKECLQVIKDNYIGYLGIVLNSEPYVVPITYYFDVDNDHILSYSLEGHKIDTMRLHKNVALQISEITAIDHWKSVMVHGVFEELQGSTAKQQLHLFKEGVKELVNKNENSGAEYIGDFSRQIFGEGSPIVFRIKILEVTGRTRA